MIGITIINLLPGDRDTIKHVRFLSESSKQLGLKVSHFQVDTKRSLERAFLFPSQLAYLIGHSTLEGIVCKTLIRWSDWHSIYNKKPKDIILNTCFSAPGSRWNADLNHHKIYSHDGLVKREDAFIWGIQQMHLWLISINPDVVTT